MLIKQLFFENDIILAPMAGITDLPFRLIFRRFGVGLAFTEMVSANGLIRAGRKTRELLVTTPEDCPLGVQLFGDSPEVLAEAARYVEEDGDLLDLNLGCPVKKVVRSGAGSALLRDPGRVAQIVAAVRRATNRPLTVKLRSGWDQQSVNFLETARVAVAEGADAITLHPRTRSQGFSGRADWDQIARLKTAVTVPVIGSGDIFKATDAMKMLEQTGCDAVMIGRGAYGNPWLIADILALQSGRKPAAPPVLDRLQVFRDHLDLSVGQFGPQKAFLDLRKHLSWYSRGLPGAAGLRARINKIHSLIDLRLAAEEFFLSSAAPSED
jgi:tRNA-dihydrouridine synthase B